MAITTFSKKNCAATKQGQLLNLCGGPEQQHLYGTYMAKSSASISHIRTLVSILIPAQHHLLYHMTPCVQLHGYLIHN